MNRSTRSGVVSVDHRAERHSREEAAGVVPQDYVREVYDVSYRRLVIQVFAVGGDLTDAEDAVQEAFVKALARGRSFVALANPEAWLRTVALNHLRNRWRHAAVVRRLQGKVPRPAEPVELGPDHVALVDALGRLDVPHRTTVVLHYLADLPVAAVAAELGVPEGTVKTRLARSRQLLAPLLSDPEEADHV
jgi:RNA polymerase sigma-70 factor (ECF subfamily)